MSLLKVNWTKTTLGEVAKWSSGGTPKRTNNDYYGGSIPWVKTGDLGDRVLNQSSEFITEEGLKNSSAKLFPKGSLGLAMYGATIGKVSIFGIEAACNQACAVAVPDNEKIHTDFLYYLLKNEKEAFIKKGKGGAQPNISQTIIKAHEIAIPSIEEQKRIADKLDSVLSKVEAAQARLDKIPAILKRFRQSVLAASTSGELTKEWRENAGINFLYQEFKVSEVASDEKYSLAIGPFGSNLKVKDYRDDGHPLVFVREIRSKKFGGLKTKYVDSNKFSELAAHKVKPGDVLVTKMGDPPGDVAIYPLGRPEAIITSDCIKITPNENIVSSKYLNIVFESFDFKEKIKSITAGVAQQKVSLKKFKELIITLPTRCEQDEITKRILELEEMAACAEKQYLAAKSRLDKLTQSVLAKAFKGELFNDSVDLESSITGQINELEAV